MPGRSARTGIAGARGLTLVELLLVMLMSAVLLTALVQIAAGARSSFRLQNALAEVQESGRFAVDTIGDILRRSDFIPEPWSEDRTAIGFTAETTDGVGRRGDRLAIRTWSEHNCFDNTNAVEDSAGLPKFYLKEDVLEVNATGDLVRTCRYGPAEGQLITQLRRQSLVRNVDAFQILYAEDLDHDGMADSWVPGGHWHDQRGIMGLQMALLLSSSEPIGALAEQVHYVLDEMVVTRADGKLRRVFT